MSERLQIFKCAKCGLVIEVTSAASGLPSCCGEPMKLMKGNTSDGAAEKHVPVASGDAMGTLVKVGSVPHPMAEDHYIEWIEVINGPYVNRLYLTPGQAPEAMFHVPLQKGMVVREYCNKHGLWQYTVGAEKE